MLRTRVLVLLLSCLLFLAATRDASAHVLKSDGPIGAVIHIDPNDDPVIGEPATFFLEFNDKNNKFTLTDCSCKFAISKSEQEVFSSELLPSSENDQNAASFSYTFSEKAVYQVVVSGTSVNALSFPTFKLTYDLRVSRETNANSQPLLPGHTIHYFLISSVVVFFLFLLYLDRKRSRKSSNQASQPPAPTL
jgi:hypothetical protein